MRKILLATVAGLMSLNGFAANADLRNEVIGKYSGVSLGFNLLDSQYGNEYSWVYGESETPKMVIAAGEADDEVLLKDFVVNYDAEYMTTTDVVGTVVEDSSVEGYLGYILVQPQNCGTSIAVQGVDYNSPLNLTIAAARNGSSYKFKPTDPCKFWITTDHGLDLSKTTGWAAFADINEGAEDAEPSWKWVITGAETGSKVLEKEYIPADLINHLYDEFVGKMDVTNFFGVADGSEGVYSLHEYGAADDAVLIESGDNPGEVFISNLIPSSIPNVFQNTVVGTVTEGANRLGYIGTITVREQVIGHYDDDMSSEIRIAGAHNDAGLNDETYYYDDPYGDLVIYITPEYNLDFSFTEMIAYVQKWDADQVYWDYGLHMAYYKNFVLTPKSGSSSVNSVVVDENAPAEYYDINGMKVAKENLSKGLYIKLQGGKATKVIL